MYHTQTVSDANALDALCRLILKSNKMGSRDGFVRNNV